jgi:hypothetical protein
MQHLPPALEQIFVGRILYKRVLEAIVGVRRRRRPQRRIAPQTPDVLQIFQASSLAPNPSRYEARKIYVVHIRQID